MKKILFLVFAVAALAACSKDENQPVPCPQEHLAVISFEGSEGLKDIAGEAVTLGDVEVSGGSAAGKHSNVFWAKGGSYDDLAEYSRYNGYLFSTAGEKVWFGSYFAADTGYGDYWGGFVLTGNYGKTATELNYANQFTVWADKGAEDSATCLLGYYDGFTHGYADPKIDFTVPMKPCHLYMANTALTYIYTPTMVTEAEYYYKVIVVGKLNGVETGRVACTLINGIEKVQNWKFVDLAPLGEVDALEFIPDSNEKNAYGLLAPAYFAVDAIGVEHYHSKI